MKRHIIVIGGGQASVQLVASLRQHGFAETITLITEEPILPYHRPPLSKAFLSGEMEESKLPIRTQDFYTQNDIKILIATTVEAIHPRDNRITLSNGQTLSYTHLVIATGASAFVPSLKGIDLNGVHVLRSLQHAQSLKNDLNDASKIAIIGGGFIGLEVAASARKCGKEVVIIEAQQRVMARAVSPHISDFFYKKHEEYGCSIELSKNVSSVFGNDNGCVAGIVLDDGTKIEADLVLLGVGARPNIMLAQAAGIEVNNGIVVNAYCQTSVPNIYAAGDCASQINAYTGILTRLESIQNATDQAKNIAHAIINQPQIYKSLAWFWSDQMSYRLQIAGIIAHAEWIDHSVYREKKKGESFSIFHYRQGKLVVVESINDTFDHMFARRALEKGIIVDPQIVSDASQDLKALLK